MDIYTALGEGSRKQQELQSLPWETKSAFTHLVNRLQYMKTALNARTRKDQSARHAILCEELDDLWPNLTKFESSMTSQVF